jgi:hypothetical protein
LGFYTKTGCLGQGEVFFDGFSVQNPEKLLSGFCGVRFPAPKTAIFIRLSGKK